MTSAERQRAREWTNSPPPSGIAPVGYLMQALDLLDRIDRILGPEFVAEVCAKCPSRCACCEEIVVINACRVAHARTAMGGCGSTGPS